MTRRITEPRIRLVAGIDVGAARKGYHAVALRDGALLASCAMLDAEALARWCVELGVRHVGVDAPSRWSADGRRRASERALAAAGISCFASPTRAAALAHEAAAAHAGKAGWYGWMFEGERIYAALRRELPLLHGARDDAVMARCCLETFPQAVACALAGRIVSAKDKRRVRRDLLAAAGIDTTTLRAIDHVDAALCALAADAYARGRWHGYGNREDGWIVVPEAASRSPGEA